MWLWSKCIQGRPFLALLLLLYKMEDGINIIERRKMFAELFSVKGWTLLRKVRWAVRKLDGLSRNAKCEGFGSWRG